MYFVINNLTRSYIQNVVHFQLNTVIAGAITGSLDLEQEGFTDKILGILKLPHGTITLEDRFYLEDFFHMRNDLSIDTPFDCASEISSGYNLSIDIENGSSLVDLNLDIKNYSDWLKVNII